MFILMVMMILTQTKVMLITMLHDLRVSLQLLKVSKEPQSPVLHLYLASSYGSRDEDVTMLRKIVSLVSFVCAQISE